MKTQQFTVLEWSLTFLLHQWERIPPFSSRTLIQQVFEIRNPSAASVTIKDALKWINLGWPRGCSWRVPSTWDAFLRHNFVSREKKWIQKSKKKKSSPTFFPVEYLPACRHSPGLYAKNRIICRAIVFPYPGDKSSLQLYDKRSMAIVTLHCPNKYFYSERRINNLSPRWVFAPSLLLPPFLYLRRSPMSVFSHTQSVSSILELVTK